VVGSLSANGEASPSLVPTQDRVFFGVVAFQGSPHTADPVPSVLPALRKPPITHESPHEP